MQVVQRGPQVAQFPSWLPINLRKREKTSFDFKLAMIYFVSLFLLAPIEGFFELNDEQALFAILFLVVILGSLSIVHRFQCGWKWPGLIPLDGLKAILVAVLGSILFFNGSFEASPPRFIILNLLPGGIVVWGILESLNFVERTDAKFRERCST